MGSESMNLGAMQSQALLVSRLIEHAATNHGHREIVTKLVEGGTARATWAEVNVRAKKLAQALEALGCQRGDRVATLAWNTQRHLEAWYGIAGAGMVAHTINPRLFAEQIIYIANHAEDAVLLFDITFTPLVAKLTPHLTSIKHYVAMVGDAHLPQDSGIPNLLSYESLLAAQSGHYVWPELDENMPCGLCYTSGTTGNPKGVQYSHRSNVLHTFAVCMTDTLGMSTTSVALPVVPMFHANAWGIPYAAAAVGAKLVFNGPHFDAPTLQQLILDEGVNFTAAVPTVWLGMLGHLKLTGTTLGKLQSVVIGGSAAPRMMIEAFQRDYGVKVYHAWGMTEMSPLGTVGTLTPELLAQDEAAQITAQCKQGRGIFGVEMKITDADGNSLPRDGKAFGHLKVRGNWVVQRYFKAESDAIDADGFFDTGDVSTIDANGYMQITDRAKDVIKSGGEWISSIDLENAAVSHPAVAEAAVIGIVHPKWDERPLLLLVCEKGNHVSKDEMLEFLAPQIAKWWLPDDVIIVESLPHTATGKLDKKVLREQFKEYRLPTAA
jgi:acyl-CoA synthetase (AMP-forming)/AMP-acid ligase II